MGVRKKTLKVLFIASEIAPIVKIGGLGDVLGSLPKALFKQGIDARVLIPRYQDLNLKVKRSAMGSIDCSFKNSTHRVRLYESHLARKIKLPIYFLENFEYLTSGSPYLKGKKNLERFIFFCTAATCFLERWGFKPDIIHLHDWHTSFIPALIKNSPDHFWEIVGLPKPKIIFTIHNLGHNPVVKKKFLKDLNFLPPSYLETKPKSIDFLQTAIKDSDIITTVSPTYKKELLKDKHKKTPKISALLKEKSHSFYGVLNGIDTSYWNIRKNRYLPYNLKISTRSGINKFKTKARNELFKKIDLENDKPLFIFVGRLYHQKGLQILIPALEKLLAKSARFNIILLGEGQKEIEKKLTSLAKKFPKSVHAEIKYNEPFAHLLYAASDFIIVPSLFEPCGLVQMIAMRYTSIPIVRKTGGLADTIIDEKEGIVFEKFETDALLKAIKKALSLFKNKREMTSIIKHNLKRDFSWQHGAKKYVKLYIRALSVKRKDL